MFYYILKIIKDNVIAEENIINKTELGVQYSENNNENTEVEQKEEEDVVQILEPIDIENKKIYYYVGYEEPYDAVYGFDYKIVKNK